MSNRDKRNQQRRQKAVMKARCRKKLATKVSKSQVVTTVRKAFPDAERDFWAMHGANCLVSDYNAGIWDPLIEDLYTGADVHPEMAVQAIINRFGDNCEEWSPKAKVALAWLAQSREVIFIYKTECIRRLEETGDENPDMSARQPHNSSVWRLFHELKETLIQRGTV